MIISNELRLYNEEQSRLNSAQYELNFTSFKEEVLADPELRRYLTLNVTIKDTLLIIQTPHELQNLVTTMLKSKKKTGLSSMLSELEIVVLRKNSMSIRLSKNNIKEEFRFSCEAFKPVRIKYKGNELSSYVELKNSDYDIEMLLDEFVNNLFMHNNKLTSIYLKHFYTTVTCKEDVKKALLSGKYILNIRRSYMSYEHVRDYLKGFPLKCFVIKDGQEYISNISPRTFMLRLSKQEVKARRDKVTKLRLK